jgi:hypothetical protein
MKTNRTWIALLALAVVVGGLYYLLQVRKIADKGDEQEYVWDLDAMQIFGVRVVDNTSGAATALVMDANGNWRLTEPVQAAALREQVVYMVDTLARLPLQRTIAEPPAAELSGYGMITPTYTIEVQVSDGRTLRLNVGNKAIGSAYYAQRGGEQAVILVTDYALEGVTNIIRTPPIAPTPVPTGLPVIGPEGGPGSRPDPGEGSP